MTADKWRAYLEQYSAALNAQGHAPGWEPIAEEARRSGWLGNAPATLEAVRATEARLGAPLPPSLKAFYAVTNGWDYTVGVYGRLHVLPVESIGWYRDRPPYGVLGFDTARECEEYLSDLPPDEDEYLLVESLMRSLAVSMEGEEAAIWLLDPYQADETGEWAAACWEVVMGSGWHPGGFGVLFRHAAQHHME